MEDEKVEIEVPVIESNNRPSSKTHRRKSSEETKFENQRRGSFVYEQISDKNKTQMMKKQFSKKATVKVTTRCDCILEQGKTVQINEYYLLKTLGKGAYGEVKLATKDLMEDDFGSKHEKYAIKMMKREAVSDDKKRFAARRSSGATSIPSENTSMSEDDEETRALKNIPESMLQEIAIMKMLVHPNLVNLLEIINDEDSKFVYLVLEHVEGGTIMGLDESTGLYVYRLTGRVMGEGTASRTFKDLISALSYLHANHIAHRDIKPDNLLVDFTGKLKLSDFGVSSHFENDRKKSSISLVALARSKSRGSVSKTEGTYSFYSPEMCTVKTVQGYSAYMADVWAATVCLWIFIFGRVPFYHPEVMTLFQMIRESDPVIPHPVSPELDDLFKSCLQKDVTLRPSAAHVRHHCWLTHEPLADYLKAQAGEDSGDDENEATKLLETDDIDIICDPTPPKRDYIPLYMVKKLKKIAARAREKCESRRDEYIHKANIEMNLLVRKAQRCRNTLNEEDEDEDSLDDLSVDSDDSDPLGRVVSFMDFDSSPQRDQNINSRRVLELSSDDGDSDPNSTPKRKQSMGSNKKSLTKLPIDEPDDENNDENDDEENNEKSLFQKYFFCCM